MLTEAQVAAVLAFSQRVDGAVKLCHAVHRALASLISEASGMDLLLSGPAQDSGAKLADADILGGDLEGKLRELQYGVTALLNAQTLPGQVEALGWTFDGWADGAGWVARRTWEPGGSCEAVSDRSPGALLHKLQLRNAEEALEHCPGCGVTDFPHQEGCRHEAKLAADAAKAARRSSDGCPHGGEHQPAPGNPRRCVYCNAWPLSEVRRG